MERKQTPAVIIASAGFEDDLEASARAFAMPGLQYVVVPSVYNNLDDEKAVAQTEPVVDEVIRLLTSGAVRTEKPELEDASDGQKESVYRISSDNGQSPFMQFNRMYLDRDWSDGYPIWPPTRGQVDALIAGVDGDPDDVVCLLPPGNGEATVAKVATNAAMAGCQPQDMPIVMAALRAIANMRPVPRGALMSTSAHAPLVLVNGPVAREVGVNGGRACLGPGKQNEVNIRISRAVVMCLKNLGSWYPGIMDLDTIGTTRKHIVVVAENEEESPWEPYHVSQGFAPEDSTVTVFFTSGEWDISIQGHLSAQQLAEAIASFSGGNNSSGYFSSLGGAGEFSGLGRLLFIPPPHAIPLKEGGFTKLGLEKYMYHHGHEPVSRLIAPIKKLHHDGKVKPEWEWLFHLSDTEARRTTLPVIERPESFSIVVVGSVRAKDLLMPTRVDPYTEPVTSTPTAVGGNRQ